METKQTMSEPTPRVDAAAVMVVNDQPFPLGHLALEPYEAVPADLARDLERALAASQERVERLEKEFGRRDQAWVVAMAEALDSGHNIPIVPDPELFRRLFASLARRAT